MMTFKKIRYVCSVFLTVLLVAGCADKTKITLLLKEAVKHSFVAGYECANEGKTKGDCVLEIDEALQKIGN